MALFTPEDFIEALKSKEGLPKPPITLMGMAKPHPDTATSFLFSLGDTCISWVEIPREVVEGIDHLGKASCLDHEHESIRIHFKTPKSHEGMVFAALLKQYIESSFTSILESELSGPDLADGMGAELDAGSNSVATARIATCSCFGPGLYGNPTACGQILRPGTVGVAHKTLPCGTRLRFLGRRGWVRASVIDRGPFVAGREFDLTEATVKLMGYRNCGDFGARRVQWDYDR